MDYLLSDEEIKQLGSDIFCGADPDDMAMGRGVATAQAKKMIQLGWKSPEEVSQFIDDHVRITNKEALMEVGAWLATSRVFFGRTLPAGFWDAVAALKSGRMPKE
jgi:hypothetical protein